MAQNNQTEERALTLEQSNADQQLLVDEATAREMLVQKYINKMNSASDDEEQRRIYSEAVEKIVRSFCEPLFKTWKKKNGSNELWDSAVKNNSVFIYDSLVSVKNLATHLSLKYMDSAVQSELEWWANKARIPANLINGCGSQNEDNLLSPREKVQRYKQLGKSRGIKITDKMIAQAANYADPTMLKKWMSGKCKNGSIPASNFERILKDKPHFIVHNKISRGNM